MRESAKSRKAFERYVQLGDARSLAKLLEVLKGEGVKVSLRTLESWSTRLHWQPRLAEIERAAAVAADLQITAAIREMNERQAKEGLLLQQKGAEWLHAEDLRIDGEAAIRALTEGARLERLARGAATERSDIRSTDVPDHRLEGIAHDQLERLIDRLEAELAEEAAAGTGGPSAG